MDRRIALGIVGDYDDTFVPHVRTNEAVGHAAQALRFDVDARWIPTPECDGDAARRLTGCDGVWISPGSPYRSMSGVLGAIRACRLGGIPLLATCGGCQHVIIEYARSVLGYIAKHAEYDPSASTLFVTPLSCSLVGKTMAVTLEAGSPVAAIYGRTEIEEQYYSNFGLNPAYERTITTAGCASLDTTRTETRASSCSSCISISWRRSSCRSLTSSPKRPHPVITALLRAADDRARRPHPL